METEMDKGKKRVYSKRVLEIERKGSDAPSPFPDFEINPPETWPRNVHHHSSKSAGRKHKGESYVPTRMREIFYLYKAAYKLATGPRKVRILGNYFGLVPWLAFAHNSWSYNIWKAAISSKKCNGDSNRLLKAIARGITTRRFEKNRLRETTRLLAKTFVEKVTSNSEIRETRREWKVARKFNSPGTINFEQVERQRKELFRKIHDCLIDFPALPGSPKADTNRFYTLMEKKGLRPAIEYFVSKKMCIPVRSLQDK
jgi:hypothetical protein